MNNVGDGKARAKRAPKRVKYSAFILLNNTFTFLCHAETPRFNVVKAFLHSSIVLMRFLRNDKAGRNLAGASEASAEKSKKHRFYFTK